MVEEERDPPTCCSIWNILQAHRSQALQQLQQPGCGEVWASVLLCLLEDNPVLPRLLAAADHAF